MRKIIAIVLAEHRYKTKETRLRPPIIFSRTVPLSSILSFFITKQHTIILVYLKAKISKSFPKKIPAIKSLFKEDIHSFIYK